MTGFSKSTFLLGVAAFLTISYGPSSEAFMIGSDLKPTGPDAVCFIGGGYPDKGDLISIRYTCSGVLISPTEVLTAAHCVTPLEQDPKLKIKVLCGYKQPTIPSAVRNLFSNSQTPRPLGDSFKEVFVPASADVNPQFTVKQAEEGGNSTNDFAIIHLATPSHLTPLQLLTPVESIGEFLKPTLSKTGNFECAGVGFGLNADNQPSALQLGDMSSDDLSIQLSFSRSPVGMMSSDSLAVIKSPSANLIDSWKKAEAQKLTLEKQGKDDDAGEIMLQQFQYLNQLKLIKASLMPGDSGGPLLCRESLTSPWKVVGVASTIGLSTRLISPAAIVMEIENNWVTPEIGNATKQVWTSKASAPSPAAAPVAGRP